MYNFFYAIHRYLKYKNLLVLTFFFIFFFYFIIIRFIKYQTIGNILNVEIRD